MTDKEFLEVTIKRDIEELRKCELPARPMSSAEQAKLEEAAHCQRLINKLKLYIAITEDEKDTL